MLTIKNNHFQLNPLVEIINDKIPIADICDAIEEFIVENKQRTIINGRPADVFYVSGHARRQHERLADYLNRTAFRNHELTAYPVKGSFADYPGSHFWLEARHLIIDIAIRQFFNKGIALPKDLDSSRHCFICDNQDNALYGLYSAF